MARVSPIRSEPPRAKLGFFPTPLVELPRLSAALGGPRLLMKRDDLTGLALGGNKTRKLEFLVGEALANGCDTLVTGGAEQSNHCRQTAAAGAMTGLGCHLVLGGEEPAVPTGNLLLDELCGAVVHWTGEFRKGEKIPAIAESLRRAGKRPCVVPYGGSNVTGALGFVEAVRELTLQAEAAGAAISHVVFPSSSGGTHAGLLVGRSLFRETFHLVGIGIDKGEAGEKPLEETVAALAGATAERLGSAVRFGPDQVDIRGEYLGGGYGVVGDLERRAIRMTASTEGIFVDPVYTGRAMGALIDLVERGDLTREDTVLFWHTGGTPALFAHAAELATHPTP
jgi:D-cysteine desulfhydrase family pyridoxal phosphate-dependent enzyme